MLVTSRVLTYAFSILHFIFLTLLREKYKSRSSLLLSTLYFQSNSYLLGTEVFLRTLIQSSTFNFWFVIKQFFKSCKSRTALRICCSSLYCGTGFGHGKENFIEFSQVAFQIKCTGSFPYVMRCGNYLSKEIKLRPI
jgi:hypothetical protein